LQRDIDTLEGMDRPIADYVAAGKAAALDQVKTTMAAGAYTRPLFSST
jgi:hypothetical protein